MIIVYLFDEKAGINAATLFQERGYDNIFLVSGGIEQFN